MSRFLTSFPMSATIVDLKKSDLVDLATTELITSLSFVNGNVAIGEVLSLKDFRIEGNDNLAAITFAGLVGITVNDNDPSTHFPKSWSVLTKLSNVSFANCGFKEEQIQDIVKSFIVAAQAGMGGAVATGKILTINGVNGKFNTSVVGGDNQQQLATLAGLGWTLQTNQ